MPIMLLLLISLALSCKTVDKSDVSAIIGEDNRILEVDGYLNEVVGYISYEKNGEKTFICSAFLSNNRMVTTAAHCIDPKELNYYSFISGKGSNFAFDEIEIHDKESDLAIISTKQSSKNYLSGGIFNSKESVKIVSFEPFVNEIMSNENSKYELQQSIGVLIHTLDTIHSSSGSPLIQSGKVVGIHIGTLFSEDITDNHKLTLNEAQENKLAELFSKEELSLEDTDYLNEIFNKSKKNQKLIGNLGIVFQKEIKPNINSHRNKISFESLVGGWNDNVVAAVTKNAGYYGESTRARTDWKIDTENMLLEAARYAVSRGYANSNIHECAKKNTSDKAKTLNSQEIPNSGANVFKFINRPPFGARANKVMVTMNPLNPAEFPCPTKGSYTAGRASVGSYEVIDNPNIPFIMHHFLMGINAGCADKQTQLVKRWANTIGHEMLHVLGQSHKGTSSDPTTYLGRYVNEYGNCIEYGAQYSRKNSASLVSTRRLQ